MHQLGTNLPSRIVIAHLGSGASLCAIKAGRSIDTTMGLTPTGGIPMATRSGDLDPGILLYLMRAKNMDADALEKLLNHDSGLIAISGGESDMRKLEAAADDPNAQLAIAIFCTAIRKTIAAYATELGGLDLLIFSGGIANSTHVRNQVPKGYCSRLSPYSNQPSPARKTSRSPATATHSQQTRSLTQRSRNKGSPRASVAEPLRFSSRPCG